MFETTEETHLPYTAIKTTRYETTLKPIKDRFITIDFDLVSGISFSLSDDSLDERTKDPFSIDPVKRNIKKCFMLRKSPTKSSDGSATETSGTSEPKRDDKTANELSDTTMDALKAGDTLATESLEESELEIDEKIEENWLLTVPKSSVAKTATKKTEKVRSRPAKEKNLVCVLCEKSFAYKLPYEKHLLSHREAKAGNLFKCDFCGKSFLKKCYVTRHFKKVHLHRAIKVYYCEECPKYFRSRVGLRDHKKVQHGPTDECWSCQICGKIFTLKRSLVHHLKVFPNHGDGTSD